MALIAAVVLAAFCALSPASAQSTALSFLPDPATLYLNGTNNTVVDMRISNAVLINAFDIIITYDANVARLTSWVSGGFLNVSGGCLINTNNPGYLRVVCTQLNKPGVSGDGVLLRFTFTGKGFGSTPLTIFKAELSNSAAELVLPAREHGQLDTAYQAGTIKNSSLTGTISLEGRNLRGGIPVRLEQGQYIGQGPFNIVSGGTLRNNLSRNPLPMDRYGITTSQVGYLNLSVSLNKNIAILSTPATLPPLELLAGDVNADGVIDLLDLGAIAGVFGEAGTLASDLNADGRVNARDLALLSGNYGLTAASAYAGWQP